MNLTDAGLAAMSTAIAAPVYNRSALSPGIVHIGVGQFHRSHQAMFVDRLLNCGTSSDWAIWGVNVRSTSQGPLHALTAQDCLYTLTEKAADGTSRSSVIGSIIGFERAELDGEPVIGRMADPATRIISLTVTEGGYGIDPVTGRFSGKGDRLIETDLVSRSSCVSWLGLVVHAVRRRRESGAGPVTLMSCDNIPRNGHVAREALKGFARVVAPDLLGWIEANMTFPNSIVDRVTPGTTDEDRAYVQHSLGLEDAWPVTCEPFAQWILEDDFANGRPALEDVGVQFVDDLEPYELLKSRLTNGMHQALCYVGRLLGYTFVYEAVADPGIRAMLIRYIDEEAVPTLRPIPGVDLSGWGRNVLQRFGNPQIHDRLTRICADTSDRIPKCVLPVIRDQLAHGRQIQVSAAVIASWAWFAQGSKEYGTPIDIKDPRKAQLVSAALAESTHPGAFINLTAIFGDLAAHQPFSSHYLAALDILRRDGARALLTSLDPN